MVFIRTGKNAPRNTRKIAGLLAMPNQMMASGIQETGGMGRNICNVGSRVFSKTRDQPMATPAKMPNALARAKPPKTRSALAKASRVQ